MQAIFVLIVYAYHEKSQSRENLEYFLAHGLMKSAEGDHIFVLNGEHTLNYDFFFQGTQEINNIDVIERENSCMDFGAWGIAIRSLDNIQKYSHIILMNSSIRGPFLPLYETEKWWHVFIKHLGGSYNVGLVGTSLNCWTSLSETHLQSMLLVTTQNLFKRILLDERPDLLDCKRTHSDAVFSGEIPLSQAFLHRNFSLKTMLLAFQSTIPSGGIITPIATQRSDHPAGVALYSICYNLLQSNSHAGDLYYPHEYGSSDIHPLETIFFKTSRQVAPSFLSAYTQWAAASLEQRLSNYHEEDTYPTIYSK